MPKTQELSDRLQQIAQCQAAIDELSVNLHAVIDAGTKTAKTLLTIWLESLETESAAQSQMACDGNESLMTIKQLAKRWGVSVRAIRGWMAKGGLPSRYVGADLRFDLAEVDEWTKRHRKNARNTMAANGKVPPLQRDCKRSGSKNNVSL